MKMMSWSRYHCLSPSLLRKPRKFSRREMKLWGIRKGRQRIRTTSPIGRGRIAFDPGEGLRPIDRPYPLTPTLSPWERGRTWVMERLETNTLSRYFQFVIRRFRT
jgi:hypothetical protein